MEQKSFDGADVLAVFTKSWTNISRRACTQAELDAAAGSGAVAQSGSLLDNASFESGFGSIWDLGGDTDAGRPDDHPLSGDRNAKIEDDPSSSSGTISISQDVPVDPLVDENFVFSAWVRAQDTSATVTGNIQLRFINTGGANVIHTASFSVGDEWEFIQVSGLSMHKNSDFIQVRVVSSGSNTSAVEIDAVSLGRSLTYNGGFEEGFNSGPGPGWDWGGNTTATRTNNGSENGGDLFATIHGNGNVASLYRDVAIDPEVDNSYVLTAWVRAHDTGTTVTGNMQLKFMNTGGSPVVHQTEFTVGDEWTLIRVTGFSTNHNRDSMQIKLVSYNTNTSELDIDDVSLEQSYSMNGGFEESLSTDWSVLSGAAYRRTGTPIGGTYFARLDAVSGVSGKLTQDVSIGLADGDSFVISAWVRAHVSGSTADGNIQLRLIDDDGTDYVEVADVSVEDEWTFIQVVASAASADFDSMNIKIVTGASSSSALNIDGLTLTPG